MSEDAWGDELADWWLGEVEGDPSYDEEVVPLALEIASARPGERWLDLGCGEGRMMRALGGIGARVIGCDASRALAGRAAAAGPVVEGRLPDLSWIREDALDGAVAVLVVEHLPDVAALFRACARVVRPEGALALVVNHPLMTAPGSAPVFDPTDGEILWRWGDYLGAGTTVEPAGEGTVTFHHRSLGRLLSEASAAGWDLAEVRERGPGEARAARDPLLGLQRSVPRLLGVRWRRRP